MPDNGLRTLRMLLLCSDKFPPFRVDVAVLFGKKIVERGHRIDWILQSDETLARGYQTEWQGGTAWVGPTDNGTSRLRRLRKHLHSIIHDCRMFQLLRRSQYDCVIVRDKFITALLAIAAQKIFKVKLVFWLSYPFPESYLYWARQGIARYPYFYKVRGHLLQFLLYKVILPAAAHVFVQTLQMRDNIAKHGIPPKKMTPVLMGVAIESIPFFGCETANGNGDRSVLYLGTLVRLRQMDFLIRVFKRVLAQTKGVRLYLVGGGEDTQDEQMLRDEARRLNIEDAVVITGRLPQQAAWEYVKDAAVCVSPIRPLPILDCGSPTKLIEYMAMGKAVVANDHPEQLLVLTESRAGICVPYEEEAFAEAIVYLLEHREKAAAMGMRGRQYVEKKRSYRHLADIVEQRLLSLR